MFHVLTWCCLCRTQHTTTTTDDVPLDLVAGMPVAFGTAHLALVERARVYSGQWVLVLGAAGGVGLAAVQVRLPSACCCGCCSLPGRVHCGTEAV